MAADLERTVYVTGRYRELQGLRVVPWSVVFALWALGESGRHLGAWWLWALGASIVAAPILTVALGAYYRRTFGWVRPRMRRWRDWAPPAAGGAAIVLVGGADTAGWLRAPVSVAGLALAVGLFAVHWGWRRYARHHLAFAAALAGLSLAPLGALPAFALHPLSTGAGVSAAMAAFFLVGGVGDHMLLARTLRREPAPR